MPPTTFYGNRKQPLISGDSACHVSYPWDFCSTPFRTVHPFCEGISSMLIWNNRTFLGKTEKWFHPRMEPEQSLRTFWMEKSSSNHTSMFVWAPCKFLRCIENVSLSFEYGAWSCWMWSSPLCSFCVCETNGMKGWLELLKALTFQIPNYLSQTSISMTTTPFLLMNSSREVELPFHTYILNWLVLNPQPIAHLLVI